MARFDGKNVLVTGGTSGIGFATAKRIADEGGRVMATGTTEKRLDAAREALPEGSIVLKNDAGDPAAAAALADAVKSEFGTLHAAFLNAGFGKFAPVEQNDAEFVDAMHDVNVRGPILQMAKLSPLLADGASVLLTASVGPHMGMAGAGVYSLTKAAATVLARTWARELAGRAIRANSISPGPIETNFFEGMGLSDEEVAGFAAQIRKQVPLGRFGSAEEVAAVATFLLSDEASYVTGSEYVVDGGMITR